MLSKLIRALSDWFARRKLQCFKKLKHEHFSLGFTRFYLITKCRDVTFDSDSDWRYMVFLFHINHTNIDPDDNVVIHFLRQLRD